MKKRWIGMLLAGMLLGVGCFGCGQEQDDASSLDLETVEEQPTDNQGVITLTVWGAEEDQELLKKIISNFQEKYKSEATFDIQLMPVGEGDCKKKVLDNVLECADVFSFADDQLMALAASGVLKPIENAEEIKKNNLEGAVNAASINDKLYAYPLTADNGYFMYYNKKYFKESDVTTLDGMLEIAKKNNKKITMDWNSGWYLYSFFGNTGLEVGLGEDGVTNYCTWNSTEGDIKGVDVAKAMYSISKNAGFQNGNDSAFVEGAKDGSVIGGISGVWQSTALKEAWGDDYAAVKLPTYTCAGKQVQMGSYVGYKMIGINSHSPNKEWAAKLAEYITSEENQTLRFEMRGQGPANINASATESVKNDLAIKALIEQSDFGSLQRIGGKYWDPVATFGENMASGKYNASQLQDVMDDLVAKITEIG